MLKVNKIGKVYNLYNSNLDRLREALSISGAVYHREFHALGDISFEVQKGESVGIIGKNGSGKSTLLKIISGVLSPSSGEIHISGRIAALLELGVGFNPDMTGFENILFSASLLGYSQKEIDAKIDDILSFADIGEYIHQPIKTYSSGMLVRLAFAVQTSVEPDILIVDEALSVGDFFFSQKCFRRMRKMRESGVTLLFVSHDMSSVRDLCERALYLKEGRLLFDGDSKKAISLYINEDSAIPTAQGCDNASESAGKVTAVEEFLKISCWENSDTDKSRPVTIIAVGLVDSKMNPIPGGRIADQVIFRALLRGNIPGDYRCALTLKNKLDQIISSNGCYTQGLTPVRLESSEYAIYEFTLNLTIEAGLYSFKFEASVGEVPKPNRGVPVCGTPWLGPINVTWDYENKRAPFLGMFGIPTVLRRHKI